MNIILSDFSTFQLTPTLHQDDLARYIAWVMAVGRCLEEAVTDNSKANAILGECLENISHYGVASDLINRRQVSVIDQHLDPTLRKQIADGVLPAFNSISQQTSHGSSLEERMRYFAEKMDIVFDVLYEGVDERPDDLIHVSCSGYISPSPAQALVSRKGWYETNVTHSYHMGCYGAFPPVGMAVGFLSSAQNVFSVEKKKVDIVHTEFLSLHADFGAQKPSDIVVTTLFSDGFAKYSAYSEDEFQHQRAVSSASEGHSKKGLKIRSKHSVIIPGSLEEMTWVPKSHVFEMYLSKNVPLLIRDYISTFFLKLSDLAGLDFAKEKSKMIFAIHPGGPKILSHIRDCLGIDEHQLRWSRDILYQHGNMSSATVPHIWKSMIEDESIEAGTFVASVAFGPGLTATGLLLEIV